LLRDIEGSRSEGLDLDLEGDRVGKANSWGEEGEEREEDCSGILVTGSIPKVSMSSTKEGSVLLAAAIENEIETNGPRGIILKKDGRPPA